MSYTSGMSSGGRMGYPPPPGPGPHFGPHGPPGYGQPIAPSEQIYSRQQGISEPVKNQNIIISTGDQFRSKPVVATCPICQKGVTTEVTEKCNWRACLCCWFTGCCIFACYQGCKGKECGCHDYDHNCPNCKQPLGSYVAC